MRIVPALILVFLAGCGALLPTGPFPFIPASQGDIPDPFLREYERILRAHIGLSEQDRLHHAAGMGDDGTGPPPYWIRAGLDAADAAAAALDGGRIPPVSAGAAAPGPRRYDGQWREARAFLYLDDPPTPNPPDPAPTATTTPPAARWFDPLPANAAPITPAPPLAQSAASLTDLIQPPDTPPAPILAPFRFSGLNALTSIIVFRSITPHELDIRAVCNGPVVLHTSDGRDHDHGRRPFRFTIGGLERDETWLTIGAETTGCDLDINAKGRAAHRSLRLERQELTDPAITAIDQRYDICPVPDPDRLDPLAATFFAGRWLSQTCAMRDTDALLLPDARDAFNAKAEALMGTALPTETFDRGDPTVPLDFSHAPRLDLIYVSYLDLKADFSGLLFERMLRFHAARGTLIRILTTQSLESRKDLALFEQLAADFPNVQLQLFAWETVPLASLNDWFSHVHRVHHIKMLLALSPDPGRSRAIMGGRNIHDGFLFPTPRDLSAFPSLVNYGRPHELSLAYFASYHDFETEIRSDAAVRTLAAHMATFWHRDFPSNVARPFTVNSLGQDAGTVPLTGARHFISIPYQDGFALEYLYVDLIDSARTSVVIVSPYLNPTPRIEAALLRAHDRGVQITIVARVRLYGDLGGQLMTELNMLFVERYANIFTMYEYTAPDVVLHSKMLLIDDRLSVVTSANLNRRSFYHDSENGLMVLNPAFFRDVRAVVDDYIRDAEPLRPDYLPIRPLSRDLFGNDGVRDLF